MIPIGKPKHSATPKGPPSNRSSSSPPISKTTSHCTKFVAVLIAARKAIRESYAGYQKVLREEIAKAYGVAQSLAEDSESWAAFCRLEHWKEAGQPPDQGEGANALRYVLRFTFGKGDDASKKASFYHRALKSFWDDDVPAEEVAGAIKARGGFKKLAAEGRNRAPGEELPEDDDLYDDEDEAQASTGPRGAKAAKAKDTEVTAPAAKGPRSAAVGKEKAPRKSGKYTAHLKAEFDVGVSFSAVPVGKRFVMKGTLNEIGKETMITVHGIDRAPAK